MVPWAYTSLPPNNVLIGSAVLQAHLQCRIKVSATDVAALGPFKKYAHGHGREKNLLHFGCDFSVWYNFGKIIKTVATRCHILKPKCSKFDFGWGSAVLKRAYF